jgi:hypothetical protein
MSLLVIDNSFKDLTNTSSWRRQQVYLAISLFDSFINSRISESCTTNANIALLCATFPFPLNKFIIDGLPLVIWLVYKAAHRNRSGKFSNVLVTIYSLPKCRANPSALVLVS